MLKEARAVQLTGSHWPRLAGGECLAGRIGALLQPHSPLHSRCPVSVSAERCAGDSRHHAFDPGRTISRLQWRPARGNNLARWLTHYRQRAHTASLPARRRVLARRRTGAWSFSTAQAHGRAGAFLAVTRGSDETVRASCTSSIAGRRSAARLALFGKGICFDTGGTNLKRTGACSHAHRHGWSAVALATLLALTRLRVPYVSMLLALSENRIGPKPTSRRKSSPRVTHQHPVIHTDAEGRMCSPIPGVRRRESPPWFSTSRPSRCLRQRADRALQRVFTNRPSGASGWSVLAARRRARVVLSDGRGFDADLRSSNAISSVLPTTRVTTSTRTLFSAASCRDDSVGAH